jgi:hypothetical protein
MSWFASFFKSTIEPDVIKVAEEALAALGGPAGVETTVVQAMVLVASGNIAGASALFGSALAAAAKSFNVSAPAAPAAPPVATVAGT